MQIGEIKDFGQGFKIRAGHEFAEEKQEIR